MSDSTLYKKLLTALNDSSSKELKKIINALLTPSELDDISLRLEILKRLNAGETQRSISQSLGVGIATVTRGSRQLQELGGSIDKFLK